VVRIGSKGMLPLALSWVHKASAASQAGTTYSCRRQLCDSGSRQRLSRPPRSPVVYCTRRLLSGQRKPTSPGRIVQGSQSVASERGVDTSERSLAGLDHVVLLRAIRPRKRDDCLGIAGVGFPFGIFLSRQ
jgi:hypothetical protein